MAAEEIFKPPLAEGACAMAAEEIFKPPLA